jgi:hypothetical protein
VSLKHKSQPKRIISEFKTCAKSHSSTDLKLFVMIYVGKWMDGWMAAAAAAATRMKIFPQEFLC